MENLTDESLCLSSRIRGGNMAGDVFKVTHQLKAHCAKCGERLVVKSAQEGAVNTIWAQIEPHTCKDNCSKGDGI